MAPQIPSLAQSESKTKFFDRLGMRSDNVRDKRVYSAMKREAAEGRKRLIASHEEDETINETDMHREILEIYERASSQTKAIYDLGRDRDGVVEENWIIRWLVWHAFRYRDQRNNRMRHLHQAQADDEDDRESENDPSDQRPVSKGVGEAMPAVTSGGVVSSRGSRFYDPVRDA